MWVYYGKDQVNYTTRKLQVGQVDLSLQQGDWTQSWNLGTAVAAPTPWKLWDPPQISVRPAVNVELWRQQRLCSS